MPWALSLALPRTGSSIAANMAMIAITTSNSIKVNPPPVCGAVFWLKFWLFLIVVRERSDDARAPTSNLRRWLPAGVPHVEYQTAERYFCSFTKNRRKKDFRFLVHISCGYPQIISYGKVLASTKFWIRDAPDRTSLPVRW